MASPVVIVCPNCSAKLTLKDTDKIGKKIRCPKCSEPFVAQAANSNDSSRAKSLKPKLDELDDWGPDDGELEDEEFEERRPSKAKNSRSKKRGKRGAGTSSNQVLLIAGSVAAVVLLGVGSWFLFGTKAVPPVPAVTQSQPAPAANSLPSPAATPGATPIPTAGAVGPPANEPFDVKAFLADHVALQDNAAPLYPEAFSEIHEVVAAANPAPARENRVAAAKNLRMAIELASNPAKIRSGEISQAQLEKVLSLSQSAITKCNQAQARPDCEIPYNHHIDFSVAPIKALESMARLCTIEIAAARQKGDFGQARSSIARTLRLSRDIRRRASMMFQYVSTNIDTVVLNGIVNSTLSQPGLTVDNIDQITALLIEHQQRAIDGLQEGLRVEYVIAKNAIDDLQSGTLTTQKFFDYVETGGMTVPQMEAEIRTKNWAGELTALNRMTSALLSNASKLPIELPSGWSATLVANTRAEHATLAALLMGGGIDESFLVITRGKTRLALTIALVAVRRYQLAHGTLPTDLSTALKEAKVTAPPVDPFNGMPLHYVVLNGKPTVYSVGNDLIDQGGKIDWQNGKQAGDFSLTPGD